MAERDETILFETIPARDRDYHDDNEREETEAERKTREFMEDVNGKNSQKVGFFDINKVDSAASFSARNFCERVPSDQFGDPESLMMYIRRKYGPGMYRILGRVEGRKGFVINSLFNIEPTVGENPRNLPAVHTPEKAGGDNLAYIVQMIAQQNQQMQQNIMMMLEQRNEKKGIDLTFLKDPQILALILPAATGLIGAVFKNRRDPLADITQLLTITGTIKDMREDSEGGGNPDTWPALINNALDKLGSLAPMIAAKPGQAPAPRPAPGNDARPTPQQLPPMAQALAPQIKQLVEYAQAGSDPAECAKVVWNSAPEQYRPALQQFLEADNCISTMARVNPGVLDYAVWFDELRYNVLELADPDQDADTHVHDTPADPETPEQ